MISIIRSQIGSSSRGRFVLSNPASCTAPCMISEPTLWRQVLYTSVPSARCSCVALRASSAAAPILRNVSVSWRKCARATSSRSPSLGSCSHGPVREYCPRAPLVPPSLWHLEHVVLHTTAPVFLSFPLLHVCIDLPYSSTYGHFCPLRPGHGPCSFGIRVVDSVCRVRCDLGERPRRLHIIV